MNVLASHDGEPHDHHKYYLFASLLLPKHICIHTMHIYAKSKTNKWPDAFLTLLLGSLLVLIMFIIIFLFYRFLFNCYSVYLCLHLSIVFYLQRFTLWFTMAWILLLILWFLYSWCLFDDIISVTTVTNALKLSILRAMIFVTWTLLLSVKTNRQHVRWRYNKTIKLFHLAAYVRPCSTVEKHL